VLFRRTVQLPVRGKHWAEVASGSAEPGAAHEYDQDCGRVRHNSFSCSVQPGRFVLAHLPEPNREVRLSGLHHFVEHISKPFAVRADLSGT
jgi:hypothetical protein